MDRSKYKLGELPDLGKTFAKLKISMELDELQGDSIFLHSIKLGMKEKPLNEVLEMIVSQYKDNPQLVASIVGYDLCMRIINLMDDNPDDLRFVNI